jgi:hypothetical protein
MERRKSGQLKILLHSQPERDQTAEALAHDQGGVI